MINATDLRSRKAGNGLKKREMARKTPARLVFPFGNSHEKKATVSLFLGTAVICMLIYVFYTHFESSAGDYVIWRLHSHHTEYGII
jgi:hypothetical protein